MIDISKGRYWDLPWSLISGCTPCSPGCDHCCNAALTNRFYNKLPDMPTAQPCLLRAKNGNGFEFSGNILTHHERLSIPLKRKKPTVYSIWNDLYHEAVPDEFIIQAVEVAHKCRQHTLLALTKRPERMDAIWARMAYLVPDNWWNGLTVCNQAEWNAKKGDFLSVPGLKFVSHEPALGRIDYGPEIKDISVLISGGETGSGARPSHPNIFRADRNQCAAAGVKFFLKFLNKIDGRVLDGKTHDELPWRTHAI